MRLSGRTSADRINADAAAWIARRDGGFAAGEEAEFARWLADARHQEAFARQQQAWEFADRPMQAGKGHVLSIEFRTRLARRRHRRIVAAAAALGCIVLTLLFRRLPVAAPASVAPPIAHSMVVAPERRTLEDGTSVELKAGAMLTVEFTPQLRRVRLEKGEAHFEVTPNAARPFVVTVGSVDIRAVGTAFAIELGSRAVTVLVTEGRVAVQALAARPSDSLERRAALTGEPLAYVDAGNRVELPVLTPPLAPVAISATSAAETDERLAWRAPRLEFTAAPLAEAIALMNRFSGTRIVIDDAALSGLEVSGLFRANNTEAFLRMIEQGLGIKAERQGDSILLRKAR